MSLLEWFFEAGNPGPTGKVEIDPPEPEDGEPPKKWLIYAGVVTGLFFFAIGLYWVFNDMVDKGVGRTLTKLCYMAIYVVVGHFIRPAPDSTNVGWLGGLVDNPFRISDDFNRLLLLAQIVLIPGRLVAYSLLMSWIIGRHLCRTLRK